MRVNLAKSAGFCFGVKRALDIALKTAKINKNAVMLGDIVHNESVVNKIRASGIKRISRLKPGKKQTLIIRAHGASLELIQKAKNCGYEIVDATCPMVKEIHKIAREMDQKGYKIIVIGDKKHDEVQGIIGQIKTKALVIENSDNMPIAKIKKIEKAAVVTQSTQNLDSVLKIVRILKKYITRLEFFNTICKPTQIKQAEIKNMPKENDCMVIIGSKNSANTKRLYEISRKLNKKSWWVNSKEELKSGWFKKAKSVGITAGASTPQETINEIILSLKKHPYLLNR